MNFFIMIRTVGELIHDKRRARQIRKERARTYRAWARFEEEYFRITKEEVREMLRVK